MTDHDVPEIPAPLATAWGLRERPGKGPKPGLRIDAIVSAATRVAATEGLSAVTMNRVATELGTAAMSLYRYVASKDELLILMMDNASGEPPYELWNPTDDWRACLTRWSRTLRAIYLANPWVLEIPISSPPVTPNHVGWMECALRALSGTTLAEADKVSTLLLMMGWVRSDATLQAGITAGSSSAGVANIEFAGGYHKILTAVADPRRFPAITAVLNAGVFSGDADDGSYDFEFGLHRILDGIELLMADDRTTDGD